MPIVTQLHIETFPQKVKTLLPRKKSHQNTLNQTCCSLSKDTAVKLRLVFRADHPNRKRKKLDFVEHNFSS